MTDNNNNVPLCVDLDGTLIRSDIMVESFVRAVKLYPWIMLLIPFWLMKGKHTLKYQLAIRSSIDVTRLPYITDFLEYIKLEKVNGRELLLVTGSQKKYAQMIADHLGIFSEVLSTDDTTNLTGKNKAALLLEKFGKGNFDYAGNEEKDKYIWEISRKSIVVNASNSTLKIAQQCSEVKQEFSHQKPGIKKVLKAIRLHQWTKNALIMVPLLAAHKMADMQAIYVTMIAFLSFSLCASATYIVNDLFDLDADRAHKTKCNRPFASGDLSVLSGLILSFALMMLSFVLLIFINWQFSLVLLVYIITTLAYSFKLKSVPIIDVIMLAGLYTTRVVAGAIAINVKISFWLLAFSVFIFLSLAIVKRVSELLNLIADNKHDIKGRGYTVHDIEILKSMGTGSGYLSVLVMALYLNSPMVTQHYSAPDFLWAICPLILFWISRVWLITARRMMNEDPIVFAIKDKVSWLIGGLSLLTVVLASLG